MRLALIAENGIGIPSDEQKAALWYQRAAEEGDDESQFRLEVLEGKDKSEN